MNDNKDTIEDLFNRLGEQEKQNVINYAYLYDDIRGLIGEIRQLQSNWNSLREWLKEFKEYEKSEFQTKAKFYITVEEILDKMNELERKDNNE
jgi:hypothetical protein